jgi:hypothetical protein
MDTITSIASGTGYNQMQADLQSMMATESSYPEGTPMELIFNTEDVPDWALSAAAVAIDGYMRVRGASHAPGYSDFAYTDGSQIHVHWAKEGLLIDLIINFILPALAGYFSITAIRNWLFGAKKTTTGSQTSPTSVGAAPAKATPISTLRLALYVAGGIAVVALGVALIHLKEDEDHVR